MSPPDDSMAPDAGDDRRSRKREQILAGAREVFLELGFEGASVDEIARRAGVSKATLYSHFDDKRALFAAFADRECKEHAVRLFDGVTDLDDAETVLRRLAHQAVRLKVSPFAQGMYRTAVAESARFPAIARAFYDAGPGLARTRMVQLLAQFVAKGQLVIDDLELAAEQLCQLCHAQLCERKLLGVQTEVTEAEIERVADGAIDTFLRAFGTSPPRGRGTPS